MVSEPPEDRRLVRREQRHREVVGLGETLRVTDLKPCCAAPTFLRRRHAPARSSADRARIAASSTSSRCPLDGMSCILMSSHALCKERPRTTCLQSRGLSGILPDMPTDSPPASAFDMSTPQAAAYLDVHRETLLKWVKAGKVRAFRTPGGWYRFRLADLDALVIDEVAS